MNQALAARLTAAGVTTLPLYATPADLAGSFQLKVPGATEFWQVAIDSDDSALRIVVRWILGCTRHHAQRPYRTADRRYRRRPTVNPPPLPADWPCVHLQVFRNGALVASLFDDTASHGVARHDRLDVTIAGNRLWAELAADGSGGVVRAYAAPRTAVGRTITDLTLTPTGSGAGSATGSGADWEPIGTAMHFRLATPFRAAGVLRGLHAMAGDLPETLHLGGVATLEHRTDLRPGNTSVISDLPRT